MDTLILGLLILKSRTIYEIREKIKGGLNMMYSDSLGSIQAGIKKLIENGFIIYSEVVEKGKYKKVYTITESGRSYFNVWVNTPIKVAQSKNSELAKLYFMGLSDKNKRAERIKEYVESVKQKKVILDTVYEQGINLQVEDKFKELFEYQLISVKYGVDVLQFEIDWYEKLAMKIRGDCI